MSAATIAAVLAAEAARAAALRARDVDALAALLHPRLVYTHATGVRHDRDGLLQFVRTGPAFLQVVFQVDEALAQGDAVLLSGTLQLTLQRGNDAAPVQAASLASAVWLRDAGTTAPWRLALFQSTRRPD